MSQGDAISENLEYIHILQLVWYVLLALASALGWCFDLVRTQRLVQRLQDHQTSCFVLALAYSSPPLDRDNILVTARSLINCSSPDNHSAAWIPINSVPITGVKSLCSNFSSEPEFFKGCRHLVLAIETSISATAWSWAEGMVVGVVFSGIIAYEEATRKIANQGAISNKKREASSYRNSHRKFKQCPEKISEGFSDEFEDVMAYLR